MTKDEQSEENKKEVAIDQQVVNDTNSDNSSNRDSLNIEDEQQKQESSSSSSLSSTATTPSPTPTTTTTTTTTSTDESDSTTSTNTTSNTPTSATSTPDSMITPTKSKGSSSKLNSKEDKNLKKQKQKEEKERLEMEKQKQKEEKEQKIKEEKERLEMEKQKQKEEKEQKIKEEKERLEMEKQKQKEEKEKLKEEKEKSKREQKDKEKDKEKEDSEQKEKDSTPTKIPLTREPSVISKIFSVKKSNSLIIERSTSPVQIDSSPSKSFIDNSNNNSSNNLGNNPDRNSINSEDSNIIQNNTDSNIENNETTGSRTSTPTPLNNEAIEKSNSSSDLSNTALTNGLNTSPSTENINVGGVDGGSTNNNSTAATTTTTTTTTNIVGDKTELSSGSSVISSPSSGTKREVVIKVTRAFAQVVHQNVMKEEGENKMRNMVINEIINTEKDYIADLNIIVNFILTPLKDSKIIPDKDISIIFSNIQLLLNVNKELLSDLLQKAPDEKPNHTVGTCFIYFFKYLKIYSGYCANQTISADHIARCSKKIPAFKQFLEEKQASTECRQCNLESFLIKPVQRLCKYPLLLRELIKNSCEGHPDLANLEKAYTEIQEVVLSVNESKRKAEIHQKMYKIHEKLQAPEKFVFFTPTRYLIREATFGELTEEKDKISGRMHYYLFNDIIMRTQKDKKSIRLETLFIIASTNVDGEENRGSSFCNTFEISQPGTTGRRFTLVADSYEQKMEWFTDLDELIKPHREEYSRNADKVLDHIKRSTIATTNPSSNGISSDSPKSLHRTQTAAGALQQQPPQQSKPVHTIPSKPLPPPPPKSKSSAPTITTQTPTNTTSDEPPKIVDSVPTPTPLPSQTPISKPRPTSTIKKTFITNSNQTTSPPQQPVTTEQAPPIPSRQPRPLSVTSTTSTSSSTTSQPVTTQQNENNTVPTKSTRPLPKPGSFTAPAPVSTLINNTTNTPATTTTTTNHPAKPIAFPSKLSNLKQAAPNNSSRSASTFVPSTSHSSFVPSSVKNNTNNNITKDDLSLPSSANNNNNADFTTPPISKPRVMPLPPRGGSAVNVSTVNNNSNNQPVPLPTNITPTTTPPHSPQTSELNLTKKPIIPPRK
ncbi:hypothetical protein ACTFIV_007478 [Dictyostelium citrinum]